MRRRHSSLFTMAALVCLLLAGTFVSGAHAATYYVPDNYATIQSAIDASASGDTIMVRAGTYQENIDFLSKNIVLKSVDGPDVTVIDGGGSGTVILMAYNQWTNPTVEGFTITGGTNTGVLVNQNSGGTLINCRVTGNSGSSGGGVSARWNSRLYIYDSVIDNNSAYHGGGAHVLYLSNIYIYNSLITNNTASYGGGGIAAIVMGFYNVYDSEITDNYAGNRGGGTHIYWWSGLSAYRTLIADNEAQYYGGGFYGYKTYDNRLTANIIARNTAGASGGGFQMDGSFSSLRLGFNTITDNTAPTAGGLFLNSGIKYYIVANNIVYGNSSLPVIKPASNQWSLFSYNDIEGGYPGTGNIDADPLFIDPDAGDYRLGAGSPCVDTGHYYWYFYEAKIDFEGKQRPIGPQYDMGAIEQPLCSAAPVIEITSVSPEAIWPPNNKDTDVVVSGTITAPEGCTISDASYAVVDEYGVYTEDGALSVADDGSFALLMTVEASRLGKDRDGRSYDVTISATDEAGDASASASAVVLHDMR